jgi:hypothetical protein
MARFHLDGIGTHALGHEAFEVGVDGAATELTTYELDKSSGACHAPAAGTIPAC